MKSVPAAAEKRIFLEIRRASAAKWWVPGDFARQNCSTRLNYIILTLRSRCGFDIRTRVGILVHLFRFFRFGVY